MSEGQHIVLDVNGDELNFHITTGKHNDYIDELMKHQGVQTAHNFLFKVVDSGDKETLKIYAQVNGEPNGQICLELVGMIMEEYKPEITITVKKPKSTAK